MTPLVAEAGEPLKIQVGGDLKVVQLAKAVGHFLLLCDVAFVLDLELHLFCHFGRNRVAKGRHGRDVLHHAVQFDVRTRQDLLRTNGMLQWA